MFVFILRDLTFKIKEKCFTLFKRFEIFRRVLDAEMKEECLLDCNVNVTIKLIRKSDVKEISIVVN